MTDNEIKKALECCGTETNCRSCPIYKEHSAKCICTILRNALDLITRQQAEIENLKNENFILSQKRANIFEITDAYRRGKSKAVKEFAERLKCGVPQEYGVIRCSDVDNLVKEMVGENNSDE